MSPLKHSFFYKLSVFATLLSFLVILLGSYVRLSNAGLGCPDWPGCFGELSVPTLEAVAISHPEHEFSSHKAWKEMAHRYLAGGLGLSILALAIASLFQRKKPKPRLLSFGILILVIFQAMLGMWTVTLKLHPLVVMTHLLGGYSTFILLAYLTWKVGRQEKSQNPDALHFKCLPRWVSLGLGLLILQIILGGWLSANYASLACPDFPTCQGRWWPSFHFSEAFTFWHSFGPNYEWGVLNNSARVTIHMMHRLGALVVFLYWFVLCLVLILKPIYTDLRVNALWILFFLFLQIALGITNVLLHLPLVIAVAHTGVAILLLFSMLSLLLRLQGAPQRTSIYNT